MDMSYIQTLYMSDNKLNCLIEPLHSQTIQSPKSLKWFNELQSEDNHMLLTLTY